jgi:YcxB-like protein
MSHSANDAVQLSFRYTEDEYLAAIRFYFWHSTPLQTRAIVIYVLVSAVLVVLVSLLGFSLPVWAYVILIGIAGVALFHGYVIDRPRAYFRADPKFRDEYHMTFTDAGIEFHTQDMSAMIAWSIYSGVVESDSFYILLYGRSIPSLTILPKRAFQSSNEETSFRQMLRRNLDPAFKLGTGERDEVPQRLTPPDWR